MKRFLAVAALLALTAADVQLHPPVNLALGRGVLHAIPASFGEWNGAEYSFEDAVVEELKADDLMIRRYEKAGQRVWLCVIYHQNRRYGAHDPLLCYQSQGYAIAREGRAVVADGSPRGLEVSTFIAEREHQTRVVWYWWTTEGLSTRDAGAFRTRMALQGTLDNRSWGAFVRVESVVRDDDLPAATARVREFSGLVARELPRVFSAAVAGRQQRP